MPLVHTRPLERRDQEEAAAQQRHQNLESESDHDQDKPLDESPPDPRLISQRLLQWQEHQEHKKRQEEQRQMQAFRIKKFSDSNTDLDYRPLATTVFKEGFQEHWGDPIVEHQREEAWEEEEDGQQQNSRRSSIQEDDHDIDVAGSSDEHNNNNFWKEQRQRQRQLAQEQDGMEADSVMDMDKTGDGEGDGDEEMDPYTRLQRARKVKEDAMKDYQKAGRNLQRAQEREEAIMFEYETELIEVGVGSSVSQQSNRHHGHGHELGHHQQRLSPPLVQLQQQQQQMEERGRYSPSTTTAAAAFQVQDDNNNEAMANSQIVPQVGNTPSVMSETPHAVMAPASLLPVSTPSGSDPRRVLSPMTTITTATENQVSNQTRSGSQAQSQSQSVPRNETQLPPTFLHLRHHSGSPRVKIKSEELDEPIFKKHALDGGGGITGPDDDSKRRRGPKYKDYDITIVIPSSRSDQEDQEQQR
ncbi:hypothetical protein BGZ47_007975 [Haplosporangium gracile]|nr:hypothetical protein BGZ47_007975 [Haplosporangium gracile]